VFYQLEVEIDGKKIIGECKAKEDALNAYDDAIASGHGAYLVEKEDTLGWFGTTRCCFGFADLPTDTFRISVGNLPPNQSCVIRFSYGIILTRIFDKNVNPTFQFSIPTLPAGFDRVGKLVRLSFSLFHFEVLSFYFVPL
jgi:hypothetical protein